MSKIVGYNIILKIGSGEGAKIVAGTTSNSFSINPKVKDSITKEDKGTTNSVVTGYDTEFGVEGVMELNKEGEEATRMDREDIIDMVLAGEPVDFVYGNPATSSVVRKGKLIVTGYSESTDAEGEATYSLNCKGITQLEKETIA